MSKTASSVSEAVADERFVSAMALLWLVRARRVLGLAWRLAVLACVLWFCVALAAETYAPAGSALHAWAQHPETGLKLTGLVAVITLAVLIALRWPFGRTGRIAAALAPVALGGRELIVVSGGEAVRGLLPRLRKHRFVGLWMVLLALLFASILGLGVVGFWPAWQSNHGHGGTAVTIGVDASVSDSRLNVNARSAAHRDYFLTTPVGRAIAEGGQPQAGESWIVRTVTSGNGRAYRVGGHDYVLASVLGLIGLGMLVVVLFGGWEAAGNERRRRAQAGRVPLADSITKLVGGARPVLRLSNEDAVIEQSDQQRTFVLGQRAPGGEAGDPAAAARRVRRRDAAVAAGVVLVTAALVTASVAAVQAATRPEPPRVRDFTLNYLAGSQWDPDVAWFTYRNDDARRDLTGALRAGQVPATVSDARQLQIASKDDATLAPVKVSVGRTDADGASVIAGGIALQRNTATDGTQAPVELTGLPAGWSGVLTGPTRYDERTATVYGAAGGSLVRLQWRPYRAHLLTDAQLSEQLTDLVRTIDKRGVAGFEADTRP